MTRALCLAITVIVLGATSGRVSAREFTFDELPFQPVDGISVQGVTFGFSVGEASSTDAYYGSFGPGDLETISEPSLTGDSRGILTLDFAVPTGIVEFGAALSTADALSPGYTVELFDLTLQSVGVFARDTAPSMGDLAFSESRFTYAGAPIKRAVIDFADAPGSFAIDNLVIVPEPTTTVPCAVFFVGLLRRRFALSETLSRSGRAR
jgi:hypothetical protein